MFKCLRRLLRRKKTILSQIRGRVLVVLAHPDDEIHTAHIIDAIRNRSQVTLYVACYSSDPIRSLEMINAARFLNANLVHDNLVDPVKPDVAELIATYQPEWIITLDPVHGNYGDHHQHRAVTEAVKQAVTLTGFDRSRVVFATQSVRVPLEVYGAFSNATPMGNKPQIYFAPDTRHEVHPVGKGLVASLMQIHASQFAQADVAYVTGSDNDRWFISLQTMDKY